ncbi:MAG: hypothetical protein GX295_07750 [Syntrophomonadaceae bacterium]|nr:hypothetical protein [Syntrophomonadaceae bacterium]
MNPRERLYAAAYQQPIDRPPCICPGGMMNMMTQEIMVDSGFRWPEAHSDAKQMAGLPPLCLKPVQAQLTAGADVICISEPSGTGEILGPRLFHNFAVKYIN